MDVSRTQTLKTPLTVDFSGGGTVPIGASRVNNSKTPTEKDTLTQAIYAAAQKMRIRQLNLANV